MKLEATILTTLMLLAGCIATPEDLESASAQIDSPLLDELGAYSSDYSGVGDAIVLRTNATPEGGLASFWWEIPEGVILEDDDDRYVQFLAAPVLLEKDRAQLERWIIMGFLADEGMLALNTMVFGAPIELEGAGVMSSGSEKIERSLEPFLLTAGGKLSPGGRIGFVVGGVAAKDVEMALVLYPLQAEWDDDEDFPEDTDSFLSVLSSSGMVALPPAGEGGMHQVSLFYQGSMGTLGGGMTITTGPIEQDGGATDLVAASRRSQTVSTTFDSGGYSIAAAGYEAGSAAGDFSATADAHGAVSESSGTIANTFGIYLGSIPFVIAMGEGDAPASTAIALQTTSANTMGEEILLIEIDIDTTLTELLGLPAVKIEDLTGSGAFERAGDGFGLTLGGARILAPGVL